MITATLLEHLECMPDSRFIVSLCVQNVKWVLLELSWSGLQGPLCLCCSILVIGLGSLWGAGYFCSLWIQQIFMIPPYSVGDLISNVSPARFCWNSLPVSSAVHAAHQAFLFFKICQREHDLKGEKNHRFLTLNIHKNSGLSNFLIKLKRTGNSLFLSAPSLVLHEQFGDGMFHHLEVNMLPSKGVTVGEWWTIHPYSWS